MHCLGSGLGGIYIKHATTRKINQSYCKVVVQLSRCEWQLNCVPQGNQWYKGMDWPWEPWLSLLPTASAQLPK